MEVRNQNEFKFINLCCGCNGHLNENFALLKYIKTDNYAEGNTIFFVHFESFFICMGLSREHEDGSEETSSRDQGETIETKSIGRWNEGSIDPSNPLIDGSGTKN